MESKDKLKKIDIDFSDILLDKKSYENVLVYDVSYKIFMGAKQLHIWFEKIYLLKLMMELDIQYYLLLKDIIAIYDRINYLVSKKSAIIYNIDHNFARIRID